jgi:uncharacterized membrane protein
MRRRAARGTLRGMYWDHMTGWGWAMMIVWSLIWIALIAVLISALVNRSRGGSAPAQPSGEQARPNARELLDQRLAGGDITIEAYQARKAALDDRPVDAG